MKAFNLKVDKATTDKVINFLLEMTRASIFSIIELKQIEFRSRV